jgi:hypothetical protein
MNFIAEHWQLQSMETDPDLDLRMELGPTLNLYKHLQLHPNLDVPHLTYFSLNISDGTLVKSSELKPRRNCYCQKMNMEHF